MDTETQANLWTVLLAVASGLFGGGGVKLFEWLRERKKLAVNAQIQQQKLSISAETQQRIDMVREYSTFLGELRGEIHGLRNELNAAKVQHAAELQTLRSQHEACLTENAILQARVRALEEKVGSLAAAGGTAYVTIDANGKVTAWSPAAVEMFGYAADEAIGKSLADLIVPEGLRPFHEAAIKKCVQEDRAPRAQPLIFRAHNKWGHDFLAEVALSGTKANGNWLFSGIVRRRPERFDS